MSKYTTELRYICEKEAGLTSSVGYNDVGDVISAARPNIFNFTYPIFDNSYKPTLETKILRHFYTREIGLESYGLWKLKLEAKMNEIMPYYNKLYSSELIEFNPLYDTDLTTSGHRDNDTTASGTSSTTTSGTTSRTSIDSGTDSTATSDKNNTWDLFSDTPQGGINGILGAEDDPSLGSNGYLTNARHIIGDTTGSTGSTTYGKHNTTSGNDSGTGSGTTSSTSANDVDYTERVYGYRGRNPSVSIREFRANMLNIDMMVIKDLEELFFQLW